MHTRRSIPDAIAPEDPRPERMRAERRAVLVAVVLLSAATLWTLRSLLPAVLLGAWLAAVTEPLSARVARRLGGRSRAASVLTLAIVLAVLAVLAVLVLPVVSDATAALRAARKALGDGGGLAQAFGGPGGGLRAHPPADVGSVLVAARELAPLAAEALAAAASVAVQLFVFVVTAYYLAIDGRRLQAGLERVSPFGAINTRRFIRAFVAVGRGIALSMGLAGVATALALGAAFVAVGAPRPLLLATLAFATAMLPIGAHLVWIPVAVLLITQGRAAAAVVLASVGVVVVGGLIDHGLRPWLVRFGRLDLHPLLTMLGLFGGVVAFGAWGVFLGPLVVAMTATAVRIYARGPILARRSLVPGERVTLVSVPPTVPPDGPAAQGCAQQQKQQQAR